MYRNRRKGAHAIYTHTHIYINILQGTLHTHGSDICDCNGVKFGPQFAGEVLFIITTRWKCNCKWNENSSRADCSPDFAAARRSPVGEIAPVFVCQRVAFPREKLPSSSRDQPLASTGGNIHWQTSTVKKYTQWDRVVDSIDRSIPKRGSRTWELSDWLYSVILARRPRTTKTRSFNRAWNGCEFFLLYIKIQITQIAVFPFVRSY